MTSTRRFVLQRDVDVTGVSGTGVVADGVVFPDGVTVLRWRLSGTSRPAFVRPTTVIHESVDNVIGLHGHDGKTRVEWLDIEAVGQ